MPSRQDSIEVQVHAISIAAADALTFELRDPHGGMLPAVEAGAHIELRLPANLTRHYSLMNSPGERHRYQIAVRLQPDSRGGSRFMHERLRVGDRLVISAPRNKFRLAEEARHSVLIAGGIGITPLYSMITRLEQLGRDWQLHYAARSAASALLQSELEWLECQRPGRVHLHLDERHAGRPLDLRAVVSAASGRDGAHFYCCGPTPMLAAFEQACAGLPSEQVHVEYFGPKTIPANQTSAGDACLPAGNAFEVALHRSGVTLEVPPQRSILDVLLDAGIDAPFSCGEGFCGSCRTAVIEGQPVHRDTVLDAAERAQGDTMMICCSRSRGPKLVLDL